MRDYFSYDSRTPTTTVGSNDQSDQQLTSNKNNSNSNGEQHLDLIDFCLAEFDITNENNDEKDESSSKKSTTKKQQQQRDELKAVNMRKWPPNRAVDYEQLGRFKRVGLRFYNDFMERLLLFQIVAINKFSVRIDLERVFKTINRGADVVASPASVIGVKKRLIVDTRILKSLEKQSELNWFPAANALYPIMTIGDGNCLCHAVLNFMIGMQDMNLSLRETLKTYINSREVCDEFKSRWMSNRREADRAIGVQPDDKELEKDWDEIKKMELNEASTKKPQSSTGGNASSSSAAAAPAISSSSSLLYLEDIHIFGLANMLQRPIVVIALEKLQNIQPIHLRGIYLPVLAQNACVRDPIVIAFHRYHFVPLVAASDEDEHDDNNKKQRSGGSSASATPLKYTSRYYEFENVDRTDADAIRYDDDEYGYRSSKPLKTPNTIKEIYNVLPLVYKYDLNGGHMKVHFLTEAEKQNEENLLRKYLNIVNLKVNAADIDTTFGSDRTVDIMCCTLDKSTEKPTTNGVSLFLDYLNAYMNRSSSSSSSSNKITTSSSSPPTSIKCKNCNQIALEDRVRFYGLCYDCFRKQFEIGDYNQQPQQPARPVAREVEAEKLEQQLEHFALSSSDMPHIETAGSFSRSTTQPRTTSFSQQQQQLVPDNYTREEYQKRQCMTANCRNIIKSWSHDPNDSIYCDECKKQRAVREARERAIADLKTSQLSSSSRILPRSRCSQCDAMIMGNNTICFNCEVNNSDFSRTPQLRTISFDSYPTRGVSATTSSRGGRGGGEIQIPVTYIPSTTTTSSSMSRATAASGLSTIDASPHSSLYRHGGGSLYTSSPTDYSHHRMGKSTNITNSAYNDYNTNPPATSYYPFNYLNNINRLQ